MNFRWSHKIWMLGVVALCAATAAQALTLGRARGTALLGQSLDISVAVQAAPDESLSAECFEAEVYYGDIRQESGQVKVGVSPGAAGQQVSVRIQTQALIDEPVVTVYLRGGCGHRSTRKYVLLADMVSEPATPVVTLPSTAATAVGQPATTAKVAQGVSLAPVAPVAQVAQDAPAGLKSAIVERQSPSKGESSLAVREKRTRASVGLKSTDRLASVTSPSGVKRPHLKLSAIELPERDPVLRLSTELLSSPVDDLNKRAEALAMWRSLNQTMEEVLAEQARNKALDAELKVLREQTAKTQQSLLDLIARLEKAEAQRYANPLVYGLMALLLALVSGLAWAWWRLREGQSVPWWSGSEDSLQAEEPDPAPAQASTVLRSAASDAAALNSSEKTVAYARTQAPPSDGGAVDIEIDLDMGPSVFASGGIVDAQEGPAGGKLVVSDGPRSELSVRDFGQSVAGTLRAINSQEMLDVRQQAEFFTTLGQYDDAIAMLEGDIQGHHDSNPLVYLDLLKILHTLSRKDEFDRYRREFNVLFTGEVPEYVQFNQSGDRLEQYPGVVRAIAEAWRTPQVLEVIEGFLVKSGDSARAMHFDLEAYRELLMLHGIASRLHTESDAVATPFTAPRNDAGEGSAHIDLPELDEMPNTAKGPESAFPEVDLNLDSRGQNLIDFEISGFSNAPGQPSRRS